MVLLNTGVVISVKDPYSLVVLVPEQLCKILLAPTCCSRHACSPPCRMRVVTVVTTAVGYNCGQFSAAVVGPAAVTLLAAGTDNHDFAAETENHGN